MHYPHVAHFAGRDEDALLRGVAEYLRSGLDAGGCCIVITATARWEKIGRIAGVSKRTVWVNADELLPKLVHSGKVGADAFTHLVGGTVARVIAANGARPVYAYGDLVGMLWDRAQYAAAIQLEEYWNDLGAQYPFRLYCGYPIDAGVGNDAHVSCVEALHSHVV